MWYAYVLDSPVAAAPAKPRASTPPPYAYDLDQDVMLLARVLAA